MSNWTHGDFPGGPMVNNLPSKAGDVGLIPGWGTKIPHAMEQLNSCVEITETVCYDYRVCGPQR